MSTTALSGANCGPVVNAITSARRDQLVAQMSVGVVGRKTSRGPDPSSAFATRCTRFAVCLSLASTAVTNCGVRNSRPSGLIEQNCRCNACTSRMRSGNRTSPFVPRARNGLPLETPAIPSSEPCALQIMRPVARSQVAPLQSFFSPLSVRTSEPSGFIDMIVPRGTGELGSRFVAVKAIRPSRISAGETASISAGEIAR